MKLTINGTLKELPSALPLTAVVAQFCKNPKHVIAELNGTIIAAGDWDKTTLKEADTIELVTFVGGG